ncbi:MAG: c-type cytochrome [Candidatus Rokuibacteriota bacterium]|nr:MAG: c-type cytochrome [Candidatus Rokubacteria bacterium]
MTAFVARWLHLVSSILLVGGAAALLLAGPSDRPTARRWEAWVMTACRALVAVALGSALVAVAAQAALLEDRAAAAVEPAALARLLLQTQAGAVWLVRGGLLFLLGAFVVVRADLSDRTDWRAARGEVALLGLAAVGLIAAASHAAAVEPDTATAIAADVGHLVASGLWVGALPALARLFGLAGREAGADARPHAVLVARRFSGVALGLFVVVLVSGMWNTWFQVGSVAGLLGTRHGRLLLVKLAVIVAMVGLAALNRRLLPALAGDAATVGRPAMRRLSRLVAGEAVLALVVLGIVAAMSVTPPARHSDPVWPLSFRLSLDTLAAAPDFRSQVLIGSQVAVLGLVALLASAFLRRLRWPIAAGGLVVLVGGAAIALPPLVSDAYPTTYQRPAVPYQATSIADGHALFARHCAVCHGPRGGGDGPAAATVHPRPPDLRAHHVLLHTAGDLFWWITHGKPPMPAFGDRLSPDERWSLVNYLRALSAADASKLLGPTVEPDRPWLVAPDFAFAVGPTPPRALKDYRGRKIVLLALYTLPASRGRLVQLAENQGLLATLDVEIVAVPTDADPGAIRKLGEDPPIFFPVVTEGAPEILETYRLFSTAPHAEFLIDRQGYLRAITAAADDAGRDPALLVAEVQQLNREKAPPPPPAEHVH